MTKSKKFLLTTVCALMCTLCTALGGISLTARATNVPFKNDGTWFAAPDLGGEIPSVWTFNEDGTLTSTNTAFTGNMLMTTNADLVGDYAIEAVFQGSNNTEVRNEINMGFTPWYLDANNFVIVYMRWQPDKGFNLINIQTAYRQNGENLSWGDCWLDFAYKDTLFTLKPTDSIKMRVEKRLNVSTGLDEYFVTVSSGDILETPSNRGIAISVPYFNKPAYVGLYTNNDTVKISNFKTESVTDGVTLPQGKALGASLRLDKNGMRFGFALKEADYNFLAEKYGENYDIGFAVMKNGITKYRSVKDATWSDITICGENYKFVVFTILGVPENETETVLSYYGYLEIGGTKLSVTETLERSLDQTVKKAYASAKATDNQTVLTAIVSVYGERYAVTGA